MAEDYRRRSDDLIGEMAGDIKVILSKLNDHSLWIREHQESDDKNFKMINDEIISAKATVKTSKWFLSILWAMSTGMLAFWEWIKTGHK
jgi:hypothetical protein